jgi:hypothetical protein
MFLVEGLATIVIGVAIFFLLPDCKSAPSFTSKLLELTLLLQSRLKQNGLQMMRKHSFKLDFPATPLNPKKQTLSGEKY